VGGCVPTQPIVPAPPAQAGPVASPEQVVEAFYRWYLNQDSVLADRTYRDSEYLSAAFVPKVDGILDSFEGGGYDPFLCAQDIPGTVTADKAVIAGDEATVVVHQIWNPGTEYETIRDLTLVLRQVDGQWRIDNILCGGASAAESPDQVVESYYRWYLDYARSTGNPLVDGAYHGSEYLTAGLVQEVDGILASFEGGGYDPFLCAQEPDCRAGCRDGYRGFCLGAHQLRGARVHSGAGPGGWALADRRRALWPVKEAIALWCVNTQGPAKGSRRALPSSNS